jgi:hypothetical protein
MYLNVKKEFGAAILQKITISCIEILAWGFFTGALGFSKNVSSTGGI